MSGYTIGVTVDGPYEATVNAVRGSLAEQGFGVLTEIDVAATLKTKLDVDVPAQVILGACRPQLAHRALEAVPSIATLLPCNVVVRDVGGATLVEAVDPDAMLQVADDDALREVAAEARERLVAALAALEGAR
ncbi:MAG TPA: DUF302 domain-containing protein [Nocardioides sp.]